MFDEKSLQLLAKDIDNIIITKHARKRLSERGIKFDDIFNVILKGEIIEKYPNDYPFPSCLKLGLSIHNVPLHICIGLGDNKIWIITGYYPSSDEWESDLKTRKAVN
ncbi:MAG: DUF4258 domain-containing protein [Ruminococcaceae bacterium]|nr:DUF4258 domain-containing protein [Oscillospiraceae bacterium]